ncbi:unnamed protein product [Cylicocyclus nassatus]|uniref:Ground-like domain-containing protein n=1 Tax=Cylicocyclus nassatus TaxID=53992 RepID=A0AA36M9P5_CYLNA|nr:unnamed protein product [Cylicocyclus nassatus]
MGLYVAAETLNYESPKRNSLKRVAELFTIPVSHADYRNRARTARERTYRPKIRTLRKSFGVTSQVVKRAPTNLRNITGRSLVALKPPTHAGQVTSDTVIPWKWPKQMSTNTTSSEGFSGEIDSSNDTFIVGKESVPKMVAWIPMKPTVSSQSVTISDLLAPEASAFNNTITLIKEFIKDNKKKIKKRRGNKRRQAKSALTLRAPADKSIYIEENARLNYKAGDLDKALQTTGHSSKDPAHLPYAIGLRKRKRPEKSKMEGTLAKGPGPSIGTQSIEDLGARIEAEEAERVRADGENPLKYMVKDGILFKKNKTPVARISIPHGMDTKLGMSRKIPQTMVESSPFISELMPPVNHGAPVIPKMLSTVRPRPTPPHSPPTISLQQSLFLKNSIGPKKKHREDPSTALRSSRTLEKALGSPPIDLSPNDLIQHVHSPPPYPFSHCYMNVDGFLCCNRYLESLMRRSFRKLRRAHRFHECSVQKIANRIQKDCENVFNTTFEVVVGIDDFAIRAHFAGDLMCKIQEGGRFVSSYATVMPSREGVATDPLNVITRIEMNLRDRDDQQMGESIQFPEQQLDNAVQPMNPDGIRRKNRSQNIPFHEKSREDIDNDSMINRT